MLPASASHLKLLKRYCGLPSFSKDRYVSDDLEVSNDTPGNVESRHFPIDLNKIWLRLILGESPALSGRFAADVTNMVAKTGVPRELLGVERPGTATCLLFAYMCGVHQSKLAFDLIRPKEISSHDVVALAIAKASTHPIETLLGDESCPEHIRDLVSAVLIVRQMIEKPILLHEVHWVWSRALGSFFNDPAYRGIRRRAARIHGREFGELAETAHQGVVPEWCSFSEEAKKSDGFLYFLIEWAIALKRSCSWGSETAIVEGFFGRCLSLSESLIPKKRPSLIKWLDEGMEDTRSKGRFKKSKFR